MSSATLCPTFGFFLIGRTVQQIVVAVYLSDDGDPSASLPSIPQMSTGAGEAPQGGQHGTREQGWRHLGQLCGTDAKDLRERGSTVELSVREKSCLDTTTRNDGLVGFNSWQQILRTLHGDHTGRRRENQRRVMTDILFL